MIETYMVEGVFPGEPKHIKCDTLDQIITAINDLKREGYDDVCIMERQADGSYECACRKFRPNARSRPAD